MQGIDTKTLQPPTSEITSQIAPMSSGDNTRINDIITCLRKFFDDLLGYGDRLKPSQLNQALNNIFSATDGWQKMESDVQIPTLFRSQTFEQTHCIIASVCHDVAHPTDMRQIAGLFDVPTMLQEICKSYPTENVKALLPIAQSDHYIAQSGPTRGHYVLLEVEIKNGSVTQATLHDPKAGLLDSIYQGASRLSNILKNNSLFEGEVKINYHGDQALLNGKDCGRYVSYYAERMANELEKDKTITEKPTESYAEHLRDYYPRT